MNVERRGGSFRPHPLPLQINSQQTQIRPQPSGFGCWEAKWGGQGWRISCPPIAHPYWNIASHSATVFRCSRINFSHSSLRLDFCPTSTRTFADSRDLGGS